MRQIIFDWFEGMAQRSVVRTLRRFKASVVLDNPSAWAWNDGAVEIPASRVERCRRDAMGGDICEVSYQAWLAWYTPLSGNGGAL